MIDNKSFEKITITPQIVVYKKILKNSQKIIDILESVNTDDSMWPNWEPWYEQGKNINQLFSRSDLNIFDKDSSSIKEEKEVLQYICEVYDFIKNDYLSEYNENNGNWPSYIKQWSKVHQDLDPVHMNIYKYDSSLIVKSGDENLMLQYHVDEMPENAHDRPWHHVVTITFYLNDDYEGGEVCFYDEESNKAYQYKPSAGDATVFPSAAPFYHAVNHFVGQKRYFLRIFIPYSSEGDKNWVEKQIDYNKEFEEKEQKRLDDFVSSYTHAITLQFPNKKVNKVYGKLVQLDEEIIVIK
jgi:hypothetical protein